MERALLEIIEKLAEIVRRQLEIQKGNGNIMGILEDIKTVNAETKEKVIALDTKLDAALAKNAGFKEAIRLLKARIQELIDAQAGGNGIDAAGAQELLVAAQEIEDSTDAASLKADILANTEDEE